MNNLVWAAVSTVALAALPVGDGAWAQAPLSTPPSSQMAASCMAGFKPSASTVGVKQGYTCRTAPACPNGSVGSGSGSAISWQCMTPPPACPEGFTAGTPTVVSGRLTVECTSKAHWSCSTGRHAVTEGGGWIYSCIPD